MKTGATVLHPPKPEPLAVPDETALLVNITDVELGVKSRTYGNYFIRGKRKGAKYIAIPIKAARAAIDMGDKKIQYFIIHAEEIAVDLARECNNDIYGIGSAVTGTTLDEKKIEASIEMTAEMNEASEVVRGFAGVFVAEHLEGSKAFDAEVEQAYDLLRQSDETLIQAGHSNFDQFPNRPDMIHDGFKRAARRWGVDAEWLYRVQSGLPDCPHCGSKLKSVKATVCATCHRDVVPKQSPEPQKRGNRKAAA